MPPLPTRGRGVLVPRLDPARHKWTGVFSSGVAERVPRTGRSRYNYPKVLVPRELAHRFPLEMRPRAPLLGCYCGSF